MYHYDHPTATPDGAFTDGNPLANPPVPRTLLYSKWPNMIQRELLNLVIGAGLTPEENEFDQVYKSIFALIRSAGGGRVGEIVTMTAADFDAAPVGCIPLDGPLLSRTTYADLWDWAQQYSRVVTDMAWANDLANRPSYSSGDGSTTFRAPDLRGLFSRWWGGNGTWDSGRTAMTMQEDQNLQHDHGTTHTLSGNGGGASGSFIETGGGGEGSVDLSNRLSITVLDAGGNEARPVNAAFPAFVRYRSVA